MDRYIQIAAEVAQEAGQLLLDRLRTDFSVAHKGDVNLVTDVDLAAEEKIVSRLQAAFPHHSFLAEERHAQAPPGPYRWIVDPLDGTTNYAHGYPVFCVSIALEIEGEVHFGVVYEPNLKELFTVTRGEGARLNESPIRVSQTRSVDRSLLATGFPYDIRSSTENNLNHFCRFALRSQGVRRAGSAAMDLCYVACGRFDGYWELKLHPWDCAAGYLMVREAGGVVTNFRGERGSIYERECIASNGIIHEEMREILTRESLEGEVLK
jgi:myo-inositol-1(or 4)-monophosphatase